ncbi:S1C family serine protease [Blastomonas sp.]|uniref:S1C family serine protease n=1 Tax=Blastomonas sp. TaxID=1909299 RepID=UPI003593A037
MNPIRIFAALFAVLVATLAVPLAADPNDIQATSRSVVRVVLIASDGDETFYVGHGSGFAVAPNKIVTNAHLLAPLTDDASIRIGIIPSEGTTTYGGTLKTISVKNDLALIEVQGGRLPSVALLANPLADGASVMAIGYPANVDRAQGLDARETVNPMAPVKTPGVTSSGRTTREFDTILHTAALAKGNSGGPLVDLCGRVVGVNSFGSLSDGNDAEYGFAISNRELLPFLRNAKVAYRLSDTDCRSAADLSAEERARSQAALAESRERELSVSMAKSAAAQDALREAEYTIIGRRENHLAVAALAMILAALGGAAAYMLHERGEANRMKIAAGVAAGLALFGVLAFATRPGFDQAEDIAVAAMTALDKRETAQASTPGSADGRYQCTIVPERSRITGTRPGPLDLVWSAAGCVNARTQYGRDVKGWTRVFVRNEDQTVLINRFDPQTSQFRTDTFLLGLDNMQAARKIRNRYTNNSCTTNPEALTDLEDMQKALRQALPAEPNEVFVYDCKRRAPAAQ